MPDFGVDGNRDFEKMVAVDNPWRDCPPLTTTILRPMIEASKIVTPANPNVKPSPRFQDLTGKRFGRLTVLNRAENGPQKQTRWNCVCDCETLVTVLSQSLRDGKTESCGCKRAQLIGERSVTHGYCTQETRRNEYWIWQGMKQRCLNPKEESYNNYGGRGITVCDRWLHSFDSFIKDMGACPSGLTIERNNVNGNYEPGNCRWATRREQMNNMRRNRKFTHEGKTMTMAEWARVLNTPYARLRERIKRGMSFEEAIQPRIFSIHSAHYRQTLHQENTQPQGSLPSLA